MKRKVVLCDLFPTCISTSCWRDLVQIASFSKTKLINLSVFQGLLFIFTNLFFKFMKRKSFCSATTTYIFWSTFFKKMTISRIFFSGSIFTILFFKRYVKNPVIEFGSKTFPTVDMKFSAIFLEMSLKSLVD